MEQNILMLDGERTAPDRYEVHLHPDNFSHFDKARAHLEEELVAYLREVAAERHWRFAIDTAGEAAAVIARPRRRGSSVQPVQRGAAGPQD